MSTRSTAKWFLVVQLLLFTLPATCMADGEQQGYDRVCFRHKIRDIIKTDCMEIHGKHDAFTEYRCFDDETAQYKPFDPDNEWEVIEGSDLRCKPQEEEEPDIPRDVPEGKTSNRGGNH